MRLRPTPCRSIQRPTGGFTGPRGRLFGHAWLRRVEKDLLPHVGWSGDVQSAWWEWRWDSGCSPERLGGRGCEPGEAGDDAGALEQPAEAVEPGGLAEGRAGQGRGRGQLASADGVALRGNLQVVRAAPYGSVALATRYGPGLQVRATARPWRRHQMRRRTRRGSARSGCSGTRRGNAGRW